MYSDGRLPPGWSVDDLLAKHVPKPIPVFKARPREVNVTFPFSISLDEGHSMPSGTVGTESCTGAYTGVTSRVLGALAQDGTLTYDGLSSTLSVPRQTIAREIQRFRESGLIRRVGSARRGVWLMEKDAERRG